MNDIQNLTSAQLRKIISIRQRIERWQRRLDSITGGSDRPIPFLAKPRKKRRMSAAGRARIAAAARARWAKLRAEKSAKPARKKRVVSAAARAKLAAAARERWKKAKAAGKATL